MMNLDQPHFKVFQLHFTLRSMHEYGTVQWIHSAVCFLYNYFHIMIIRLKYI